MRRRRPALPSAPQTARPLGTAAFRQPLRGLCEWREPSRDNVQPFLPRPVLSPEAGWLSV